MAKVGELFIALSANTTALTKDLKRSTSLTQKSAKAMEQAFKVVGVALAAAAAATAVFVKKSIDTADRMGKMSREVGISTETLSALSHQADLGGTNIETLGTGLQRLARNLSDAQNGLVTSKRAFADLGIKVTDSKGNLRGVEGVLSDVANSFSKMQDGTKKTALAMELMGRGGVQLINTLNTLGEKGLPTVIKEARALGILIDMKTAVAAENFNDSLTRLQATSKGLGVILAAELLPTLNRVSNSFVDAAAGGEDFRDSAKGINKALLGLLTVHGLLATAIRQLGMVWKTEGAIAINLFRGDFAGAVEAFKLGLLDMREFSEVNMRGIREAWEETAAEIQTQASKSAAAVATVGKSFAKAGDAVQKLITGLRKQAETTGLTERALLRYRLAQLGATEADVRAAQAVQELLELRRSFFEAMRMNVPKIEPLAPPEIFADANEELRHMAENLDLANAGVQGLGGTFQAITPKLELLRDVGQQATASIASGFANLITSGGNFSDLLKNLAKQLANLALQIVFINTLKSAFSGLGLFGFQHGGRPPVGRPSLVGEAGPELFVPDRSGSIISNQALQGLPRGGGGTTQVFQFKIDARGAAPGTERRIQRAIMEGIKMSVELSAARIAERSLRSA